MKAVRKFPVRVLAGILVLRSAKMAEFMNANIPGVDVPQAIIEELRAAGDERALEAAGAFAIVLETAAGKLGKAVTHTVTIATIGLRAGPHWAGVAKRVVKGQNG